MRVFIELNYECKPIISSEVDDLRVFDREMKLIEFVCH